MHPTRTVHLGPNSVGLETSYRELGIIAIVHREFVCHLQSNVNTLMGSVRVTLLLLGAPPTQQLDDN